MRRRSWLMLGAALAALAIGGAARCRLHAVSERRVLGFVVGWDPASLRSLETHGSDLTHVVAEGLFLGARPGTLQGDLPPAVLAAARRQRLPVLAMVSNYEQQWRPERVRRLWATPRARSAFATAVAGEVERRGLQGVNLDFESLGARDRAGFAALCAALGDALRPRGLLLTVDVPVGRASSTGGAYDLTALARLCDLVVAMIYDEHGATSPPGPVAARDWAMREVAAVSRSVPAAKLVVGVGAYGYDWGLSGPASVISFTHALTTARSWGATVRWDPQVRAPSFRYAVDGAPHAVWFEDAASASSRIAAARRGSLAGISVWRLGTEDPTLWDELRAYRGGHALPDSVDSPLSLADVVQIQGEGDFLTVTPGTAGGLRRFRRQHGEVVEAQYPDLPAAFLVHRAGALEGREVALTFDDGPDPEYTPRVLDVLRREAVPAAFFVVGSRVQAYPELVRRIYAEGHILGNHTYTHVNTATASSLRTRLELNATQRAIEAITGHCTALFRPPYDTDSRPETRAELAPLLQASEEGYISVAAGIDPADWSQHNPDEIVRRCLRDGREGGVIVLHDAGGDRSATVRALPRLIRAFRARGCRFVALHDLIGRSREAVMPAVARNSWGCRLVALTVLCLSPVSRFFAIMALLGLALTVLRALVVPPLAYWHYRRHRLSSPGELFRPTVSVLVPAFNEERVIGKTLHHLLSSDYADLEIVVIDDGSTDGTAAAVAPFLADPRVRYVREQNGGKGAALNAGIRHSRGEIVVALDADTLFEPTTISRLVRPFAEPRVGAVAGNIKVGNRHGLLTQWQSLEYIVGNNLDKRFFDLLNCVTVVPGSVGAWRRQALENVGGFSRATLAEDTDLTFAVRRAGYHIFFEPASVAWTEAPATVSCLAKQRLRWIFGTFQCLWKHRGAFLNPRAGTLGLVALPYVLVFHVLMLLVGPLVDLSILGMSLLGQWPSIALLAGAFLVLEWLLAVAALAFEREPKWPLLLVPLQRLVYRQIIYWVALKSALCVLRGTHLGWQKLARAGSATVSTSLLLAAWCLLAAPTGAAAAPHAAPALLAAPTSPAPPDTANSAPEAVAEIDTAAVPAAHLPSALFEFDEFWDLVDQRGLLVGFQMGSYPQPVSDSLGRGAAVRSGESAVLAVSLDRVTALSVERFEGHTRRPDQKGGTPLDSNWTGLKLTRRVAPGTTVSLQQFTGDAAATGFSVSHGRAWGPWEAEVSFWSSTDTAAMSLDTTYSGFGATLSRSVGRALRLEVRLDGPLVQSQLAALTLHYAPDDRTNAALALRRWYGTPLLELRGWRRVGSHCQLGAVASSEGTLSLCVKQRL